MNPNDAVSAIGEIIRSAAMAVAEAQFEMDKSSIAVAELMTGQQVMRDAETGQPLNRSGKPFDERADEAVGVRDSRVFFGHHIEEGRRVPTLVSMMELGFVPNFYQFVDTVIEVKLALKWSGAGGGRSRLSANTMDATYASSYSFSGELTSTVRTKIVPVPPPALLDERIRKLLEQAQDAPQADGEPEAITPSPEVAAMVSPAADAPPSTGPVRLSERLISTLDRFESSISQKLAETTDPPSINYLQGIFDLSESERTAVGAALGIDPTSIEHLYRVAYFLRLPEMSVQVAQALVLDHGWTSGRDLLAVAWPPDLAVLADADGMTEDRLAEWKRLAQDWADEEPESTA